MLLEKQDHAIEVNYYYYYSLKNRLIVLEDNAKKRVQYINIHIVCTIILVYILECVIKFYTVAKGVYLFP